MQTATLIVARVARVDPAKGLITNLHDYRRSLNQLKQETARRGLFSSGNKATSVTCFQHVGKRADAATVGKNASIRHLATAAAAASVAPSPTLDIKLPDLSPPQDTEGPHIPFLPDFWDSSRMRALDAIHHSPAEAPMPKVLISAGTHASSPTYSVSNHSDDDRSPHNTISLDPPKTGLWRDVATDLGLPQSFSVSVSLAKARDAVLSLAQQNSRRDQTDRRSSSRPLNADEARGVWIIVAILGGSWLAGGLFRPSKNARPNLDS